MTEDNLIEARVSLLVRQQNKRKKEHQLYGGGSRFVRQKFEDAMVILDWQQYQCVGCGLDFREDPNVLMAFSNVLPYKKGKRGHEIHNLVILCLDCAKAKRELPMRDFLRARHGEEVASKFARLHTEFMLACMGI